MTMKKQSKLSWRKKTFDFSDDDESSENEVQINRMWERISKGDPELMRYFKIMNDK